MGDESEGVTEVRPWGLQDHGQILGFSSKWNGMSLKDLKQGSDKIDLQLSVITLPTLWRPGYKKKRGRR